MIYTSFAQVYDHLMDDTLYADWLDYVQSRVTPANQQLLELAGGSGTLAVALAQAGYDVTLSDLSEDMLTLAGPKMDAAGVELPIIQADMRYLGDIGPYDVVTCFDDSICYMPNLGDVQTTFKQVAHVLKPGGRFMFDAHSLHQMDDVFPGYMYNYQTEDYAFMWHSYAGEVEHSVEHDLTFFVYQEDLDAYKPFIETHKERTYPVADFVAALTAAGFDDIQVTADFGRQEVTPESTRWFFSAVKTSD
ncbi:class I SAM-dependent DNA methyltransferase [Lacticaseibacillus pantheris]|jgi:ubiquinone/menaquinone biosynthesis C-methylase UbiE|uniref:class I SAM-dependent DNA methyltransferase n=1 Tax=Lacticaseibacillus pantheris TaxID=171523 RepID=UPI00259730CB|nr:class I SAM-dependent methyltransferase [Lacticaseibacillus pantheris]WKF84554.1 class I SAM-dependent methyltransferase [Lacticaseibacillus pantheris]